MKKKRRVAIMLDLEAAYSRHTDVFAGTQRFATECGTWDCVIDEIADHRLPADGKAPIPYDGVIARATKKLSRRANLCGIPLVNVWINTPTRGVPSVFPDMEAEGRIAAQHLIDRGFRSFTCLRAAPDRAYDSNEKGFVDCVTEAGLEYVVSPHFASSSPETINQWMTLERILSECIDCWEPPIGVFLLVESYSRIVVQLCAKRGLRVPEDVAIIINQNELQFCENPPPSITSIDLGYETIGYEAAVLLDRLMEGGPPPKKPILMPPKGLIVRQSTDFYAVDDEVVAEALRFIASNIAEPIGVDDVVANAFASRSTLHDRFREHLGRSIGAEIRRLRIERAKRHLTESKSRIADIAREVGFGTQNRMNDVFRRELGISPSKYRKKHAK